MKEKLIELLKLEKNATDEQIIAAVSKLQGAHSAALENIETLEGKLARLVTEVSGPVGKVDPRIAQKMAAGLTFQQASEVIASQNAADKEAKSAPRAGK